MRNDDAENFVVLAAFGRQHEASMLMGALDEAGIVNKLSKDDSGGLRPFLAFASGGYQVFVLSKDIEQAKEIYDSLFGRA